MPGHFQSMVRSVWDFSLYGEIAPQRARRTVGYFVLLILAISIIDTALPAVKLYGMLQGDTFARELGKIPTITIRDHEAHVDVPQPYVRELGADHAQTRSEKMMLIIDTTGQTADFARGQAGFLVTKHGLVVKGANNPMSRELSFTDLDDVVLDAARLHAWAETGFWILVAVIAVFLPLYYAAAKLVHALLISLIALIAATGKKRPMNYGALFTISIYALTPAVILDTVVGLLPIKVPLFWLIYLAVAAVYVVLAVRRIPDEEVHVPMGQPYTPGPGGPKAPA